MDRSRRYAPPCKRERAAHRWAGAGVRPSDRIEFAWCVYCKAVRWRRRGTDNWDYGEPPTNTAEEAARLAEQAKRPVKKPPKETTS